MEEVRVADVFPFLSGQDSSARRSRRLLQRRRQTDQAEVVRNWLEFDLAAFRLRSTCVGYQSSETETRCVPERKIRSPGFSAGFATCLPCTQETSADSADARPFLPVNEVPADRSLIGWCAYQRLLNAIRGWEFKVAGALGVPSAEFSNIDSLVF